MTTRQLDGYQNRSVMNDYRSKLRSSPSQAPQHMTYTTSMSSHDFDFDYIPSILNTPSKKQKSGDFLISPHKSGYFLRTPSPLRKLQNYLASPTKASQNEIPGTPSPQKPTSATDLFGNKSLLDNLDVPDDWDENLFNNFQDDWLMGIGAEDLENLSKSPLKSPGRGQTFLSNNTNNLSPKLTFPKSPLLTSSPKQSGSGLSPLYWGKLTGVRPLTRQRKLFLQSPEKQHPQSSSTSTAVHWNAPLPFSTLLDASSSSALSDGLETTSSLHSISSYLKNFDDEDTQEDIPVMPPVGWTSKSGKASRTGKTGGKCSSKLKREKKYALHTNTKSSEQQILQHNDSSTLAIVNNSHNNGGKRVKIEPQFTLLRPHTELHTHQISLHTTPVTPPNKIKISRDFSQIQTLPSKEQLRIVRNRFTETLNKAVEQVIEREKSKKNQNTHTVSRATTVSRSNATASASASDNSNMSNSSHQQQPSSHFVAQSLRNHLPLTTGLQVLPQANIPQAVIAVKPTHSKKRRL